MTPGHALVSAVLHLAAGTPPPSPVLPDLPTLPPGIKVPPERTGQIVAAAMAILLDLAGLAAVGIHGLLNWWRRRR